jgi:hypothetical protein
MKRIFQIDALRGLMLVSMGVNHMLRQPAFASVSYLQEYTYEPLGFFSAAEGFFFLSGLIAGIVYGKPILNGDFRTSKSRALKRAREIYVVNMTAFCSDGVLIRDLYKLSLGRTGLQCRSAFAAC